MFYISWEINIVLLWLLLSFYKKVKSHAYADLVMNEILPLGCIDERRTVLYAMGVLCAFGMFSSLSPVSDVHTRTSFSAFRGRTLLAVDQLNADSIKVNAAAFFLTFLDFWLLQFFCRLSSQHRFHPDMSVMLIWNKKPMLYWLVFFFSLSPLRRSSASRSARSPRCFISAPDCHRFTLM